MPFLYTDFHPLCRAQSGPNVSGANTQFIANGAFCAVYACKYREWRVVAKRVRQDLPLTERKIALANLWTEYDCLRSMSHPNVIEAYGMW